VKLDGAHAAIIVAGFALAAFVFWLSVKSGLLGVANSVGAAIGALVLVLAALVKQSPKQPTEPEPPAAAPPTEPPA
jgi:hypothetical protein